MRGEEKIFISANGKEIQRSALMFGNFNEYYVLAEFKCTQVEYGWNKNENAKATDCF